MTVEGSPSSNAFDGRVVLVTGGAGGIGRACGSWFAVRGACVVLVDVDGAACDEAASAIGARDALGLDVTDEAGVESALQAVDRRHGPVGVLVNAAGIVGAGGVESMSVDAWRRVLDVNLTGTFLVTRATIPHLRRRGGGKIVNLSSVNARTGGNRLSGAAYAASKAGVEALTRHLALELAPSIQVNAVAPGPVLTAMLRRLDDAALAALAATIPAGRVATAEEVAEVVGFLASPAADFVTGVAVAQNGGQWVG
jgi:3-oxoacyl-[acyl-carrier protein] reductase